MSTFPFMAILDLSIISLLLTIALIVALISFIIVVNLNKKLTKTKNVENINFGIKSNFAMLASKQLVNNLDGLLEVNDLSTGETIYYMKLPSSKNQDLQPTDNSEKHVPIITDVENETIVESEIMGNNVPLSKTDIVHAMESIRYTKTINETESELNSYLKTSIDPDFLHRVTCLIYREITNTDNIIEVISSELCMSSSQLNRRIKIMTEMTTSHFILVTRLKRAQKQLALTQKPIGEIALECGFNDFAYFSRSFKKMFDMTPTTFQRIPH